MPANFGIDSSKSLAQLTGVDWGDAPADARILARERHAFRRTPIRELSNDAIVRCLDGGHDAQILVPVSLERLRNDWDAVDLLCALLRADHFDWRGHPELVAALRDRVYSVANAAGRITNDLERLACEATIWRHYAEFERRLSVIQ
jgi:hypothetical protein